MLSLLGFIASHPLNSNSKLKAILRFIKWQIGTYFNPFPIIYQFTKNSKLIIWKGLTGATQNLYCGLHEFNDMGFLLHMLRPDDLFVDIGANIGSYTILASAEIGANTISVEPIPRTFHHLMSNILVNNIESKVRPLNIGVSSVKGVIKFTESLDTMNHVAIEGEKDIVDIEVNTLDNIVTDKIPLLIKIDVEGFETEVLEGAKNSLVNENLRAIIIELNGSGSRYNHDEKNIHTNLSNLGFKPYKYNPLTRELTEILAFGSHNTIYIRDFLFVKERLLKARKITVNGNCI